ncbi:hypothetical protein Tco_0461536 [Tanacetum coccineum]
MASFPCLEELGVAANFKSLFDRMMLYFERETSIDFYFAADLHNLWVQFIDSTNDRKLFISELDGLPPSMMSYNCCQFLHQVQENDFIKLLELRKMIAETYRTDFQEESKNKQIQARNGKDKVKSKPMSVKVRKSTQKKSKVNQVKKIQLEGLKSPILKIVSQEQQDKD